MISIADLQGMAREYLRAAKLLRTRRSYDAAVYLCGYAGEIALKARICRTLHWTTDFPETSAEFHEKGTLLKTHNFLVLLEYTGIGDFIRAGLLNEWSAVCQWTPEQRYNPPGTKTLTDADKMIMATQKVLRALLLTAYVVDTTSVVIAEKFREAEEEVARQQGDFTLFALFEREEVPGKWDLVAAAPWLDTSRNSIKELIDALSAFFDVKEWKIIATVVPMKASSDFVQAITRKYHFEHRLEEIGSTYVNGLYITHAFLITSNPSPAPVAAQPVAA